MKTRSLAAACAALVLSGCATIIKGSGPENLSIRSSPPQADVRVVDAKTGTLVAAGKTPFNVVLAKSKGFFSGAKYNVELELPGYARQTVVVDTSVSGWYVAGNLVFGGLIGWLIVDPATGAMWTLAPDQLDVTLVPAGVPPAPPSPAAPVAAAPSDGPRVAVLDLASVPPGARAHLVPVR